MMGIRATAVAAAAAVWIALPGQALGADALLSLGGGVEWDNNINRTRVATENDFVFRIRPKIRFLEDEGDLTWNVFYVPTYEKAVETDRVDGFRHYFTADASYHLSDRTEFFLHDRFRLSDAVNTVTALDAQGGGGFDPIAANNRLVFRNHLVAGVEHSLTPRMIGNLLMTYDVFQSEIASRSDNQSYGGNGSVRYLLSPQHTVGAGVAATYQDFEASADGLLSASNTLFVNLYASWTWLIDETTSFDVRLGPTFVDTEQLPPPPVEPLNPFPTIIDPFSGDVFGSDDAGCQDVGGDRVLSNTLLGLACADPETGVIGVRRLQQEDIDAIDALSPIEPMFPAGETPSGGSGSGWTVFGEVSITKRWSPNLRSSLSYTRRDSTASGVGGSTVLDNVGFFTHWRISPLWDTSVRGAWTNRRSSQAREQTRVVVVNDFVPGSSTGDLVAMITELTSQTVNSSVDTDRYTAAWRLTRRITKRFNVSTRYTYVKQQSAPSSNAATSDFDDHLVTLNFQYDFDRWNMW